MLRLLLASPFLLLAASAIAQPRAVSVGVGQAFLPAGDLGAHTLALAVEHPLAPGAALEARLEGLYAADQSEEGLFETGRWYARRHLGVSLVPKLTLFRADEAAHAHALGLHAGGGVRYHADEHWDALNNVRPDELGAYEGAWPDRRVHLREGYDEASDTDYVTLARTYEERGIRLGLVAGAHYTLDVGRLRVGAVLEYQAYEASASGADLNAYHLRTSVGYAF